MVRQASDGTVEFRFFRPRVRHLALAGDFNNWDQACLPMTRDTDGWWRCELRLDPGCYQFRYVGDGQWYTDHAAFGVEHGPFGLNSVVVVEPTRDQPPQARPAPRPAVTRLPHISETARPSLQKRAVTADELWSCPADEPLAALAV